MSNLQQMKVIVSFKFAWWFKPALYAAVVVGMGSVPAWAWAVLQRGVQPSVGSVYAC